MKACLNHAAYAHFHGRISGLRTDAGLLLGIWMLYHIIELANPYSGSREASFLAIRVWVPFLSCYFIMYSSVQTRKDIDLFLSGWFCLD